MPATLATSLVQAVLQALSGEAVFMNRQIDHPDIAADAHGSGRIVRTGPLSIQFSA
jgi:hypothetical protein